MDETAGIVMGIALVFYTIGVWSEKIQGRLKLWHVLFFALGLICDSWGTEIMFQISDGISFTFHGISGIIAILLMILHTIWAAVVLYRKDERLILKFHRYSLLVWTLWLIPYLSPMFLAISSGILSK